MDLLRSYEIRRLTDIRRYPGSRTFPHFDREALRERLAGEGIGYQWVEALGGRRRQVLADSPNGGLRSAGFRNYADYMLTEPFRQAADLLIRQAAEMTTAVMCAEKLFWKCHRRILSDFLLARGVEVVHIVDPGHVQKHVLSSGAVITRAGQVHYPSDLNEKTLFDP